MIIVFKKSDGYCGNVIPASQYLEQRINEGAEIGEVLIEIAEKDVPQGCVWVITNTPPPDDLLFDDWNH